MTKNERLLKEADELEAFVHPEIKRSYFSQENRKLRDENEGLRMLLKSVQREDKWIPVKRQLPENADYILLSFENFSLPMVGRYEEDTEGGAFYLGDCDEKDTCISMGLFVNAWRPLPEPYRPERRRKV